MAPVYTSTSRVRGGGPAEPGGVRQRAPRDSSASRPGEVTSPESTRAHAHGIVPVHQHAGEAVPDRGAQPAHGGGDHRGPAGLSLERHQPERIPSATARARRSQPGTSRPVPAAGTAARTGRCRICRAGPRGRRARPGAPTSDPLGPPTNTTTSRSASPGAEHPAARPRRAARRRGPFSGWIRPSRTISTTASAGRPQALPGRRRRPRRPEHRQVHARADRLHPPGPWRRTGRSAGGPLLWCWRPAGRRPPRPRARRGS